MAAPIATTPQKQLTAQLAVWLPVLTALLGIAYLVAGYFLLLVPKIGPLMQGGEYDFSVLRSQIADDQNYIDKMKTALDSFNQDIDSENKLRVSRIIPSDPDIPGLFVQIDAIASKNKMLLHSVDTAVDEKNVTPLGRKSIRISISVEGGDYNSFKQFLSDLERSLRLFDIQQVSFTPPGGNYGLIMDAYYYSTPAAAPAPAQ